MANVLVACEYSGVVREAFRARGHNAWSCDLLPAEDGSEYHLQFDVLDVLAGNINWGPHHWDLMIAHPPCTYLCNSGVRWLRMPKDTPPYEDFWDYMDREEAQKVANRWNELEYARAFFMSLLNANIPKIAIENPIPHKYGKLPKYNQIIQPWQFGHGETKATCLWLKNLLPLQPTDIVDGREARVHKMAPGPERWKDRSRTYTGIAEAMAEQWGPLL